ncbi:UDP-N-acetylmuramoyl-tripeptide--D-alanyl-D-alanine ligase [Altericista sp. CCNU0014]|uniref:UDP-N-acetylmuramoyl-tripeptide--D-alanyl-D- alanine ligase n=1 Tax=Altericista sp. CCNU0014 TaxID=3082949 RepID=UPI00384E281B
MTFQLTLAQLIDVLNATPLHVSEQARSQVAVGLNTDTRAIRAGEIFLALRGESFDGHRFVEQAIAAGAIAAIVDRPIAAEVPQILVENTLRAYQALGRWWRDRFSIPVIAITGSVGKTTTKELVAAALATAGSVLKTEANFNNEIGVPKTLLNLDSSHDFAVIEMGMRGPGEIEELTRIARPTIGLITNVGTAHIGRLGSREAIARAKCELLATMPADSIAILNAENPLLLETAKTVWQGRTIAYGLTAGDLRGTLPDDRAIKVEGTSYPLPLPGEHNALNFLAVLAIMQSLQLDDTPLRKGITVNLPEGRAQQYQVPNDIVLLDETYNAGAESMSAALKLLAQTPGKRRIAVLGPMKELGDYAEELHCKVGEQVEALKIDALYILDKGAEGTAIAQGAGTVPTQQFEEHDALAMHLASVVEKGDRLLFKASHSVGLDRVVNDLKARLRAET